MENHFLDLESVFGDSTPAKANANKRECAKETVKLAEKYYKDRLLEEKTRTAYFVQNYHPPALLAAFHNTGAALLLLSAQLADRSSLVSSCSVRDRIA